jgi:predicted alpha/beta-hydrolase family hydrolase
MGAQEETVGIRTGGREVSGLWTRAPAPLAVAVVAHGAGNDARHPLFQGIAQALQAEDVSSLRFNFPYTEAGRRGPDPAAVLLEAWGAALALAGREGGGLPVVAAGKSLGGRMASVLAAEQGESFPGAALVFFGYPLHAPGRFDRLRQAHLARVRRPMLFIQGTRDPLARFDLIEEVTRGLGPLARLHRVEGGDHSFRVRGAPRPDREIGLDLGAVAAGFIRETVGAGTA